MSSPCLRCRRLLVLSVVDPDTISVLFRSSPDLSILSLSAFTAGSVPQSVLPVLTKLVRQKNLILAHPDLRLDERQVTLFVLLLFYAFFSCVPVPSTLTYSSVSLLLLLSPSCIVSSTLISFLAPSSGFHDECLMFYTSSSRHMFVIFCPLFPAQVKLLCTCGLLRLDLPFMLTLLQSLAEWMATQPRIDPPQQVRTLVLLSPHSSEKNHVSCSSIPPVNRVTPSFSFYPFVLTW